MWLFSVTFSVSLCVNPRQSRLLEALRRFLAEKVPTDVAFLRHLLIFVMSQPASEKAPGGPASIPCREGADRSGLSPSPCLILLGFVMSRAASEAFHPGLAGND